MHYTHASRSAHNVCRGGYLSTEQLGHLQVGQLGSRFTTSVGNRPVPHSRRSGKDFSSDDEPLWQKIGVFLGLGSSKDPGDWNLSPEWFGQQGGGWGRNSGDVVFEKMSDVNGIVQVTAHPASLVGSEDYAEWRVLRFNSVTRQSVVRLHHVEGYSGIDATCLAAEYLKTVASIFCAMMGFRHGDWESIKTLAIGIGGGSMPLFLLHYFPSMTVDAVEIDPVVIEAATSSMGFPEDSERLETYVQDAATFVQEQESKKQYDFVYIDAFDGDDCIPPPLCEEAFIMSVSSMMHPEKGVLVMNFHSDDQRALPTANHIASVIQGISFTVSCRIQKNFILCCFRSKDISDTTSDALKRMVKNSASFVSQSHHQEGFPFSVGKRAVADFTLLNPNTTIL